MSEQKVKYYENAELQKQREFLNLHTHCILCNTSLELQHIVERDLDEVQEIAHCPECDIRTRAKTFRLQ